METEEQRNTVMEKFENGILKEARVNKVLRERIVGLVYECHRMGIF